MSADAAQPNKFAKFLAGFESVSKLLHWVVTVAVLIGGYWLYVRDSQTAQAQSIGDLVREQKAIRTTVENNKSEFVKQNEEMKRILLTKDVYEASHRGDEDRMARMERLLERILERP